MKGRNWPRQKKMAGKINSMKFETIFIEHAIADDLQTLRIVEAFPKSAVRHIRKVEDVFARARKPYLQKRTSLNLFVGRKEGQLVKPAPDAYGLAGEPHYYFVHAYNCIYECEYCYLQGYFKSPDLVFFVNHAEIIQAMQQVVDEGQPDGGIWFHAGEFSDCLALSHITREWEQYWPFFIKNKRAYLELRTKSVNIRPILALGSLPNVIVSFSLSPGRVLRIHDHGTPSLSARLKAIQRLCDAGFQIGLHFDPIIYQADFAEAYRDLIANVAAIVPPDLLQYISLGVVRFTRDVFAEFARNYPDSELLAAEFVTSFDGKVRYMRPMRRAILREVEKMCIDAGISPEKLYLCMENEAETL